MFHHPCYSPLPPFAILVHVAPHSSLFPADHHLSYPCCLLSLPSVVQESCPPIVTTSIFPYEQWLIGRVVVVCDMAVGWVAFTVIIVIKRIET